MADQNFFSELFALLPSIAAQHNPQEPLAKFLKFAARKEIERAFDNDNGFAGSFEPFGHLIFPFQQMGAVDSRNLFDFDELVIFSYYLRNRTRYSKVLDAGANLGLHSIMLSRCGFEVIAYEPDPEHFQVLNDNLSKNGIKDVITINQAISTQKSVLEFTRVLGNTTSSHLSGSKPNPYGELDYINVETVPFRELIEGVDLVKMDIEGHEKEVLLSTERENWEGLDAVVEIGSEENALSIYHHFRQIRVNLFAQKRNWQKVEAAEHVPTSYREGSLFISRKEEMPW